MNKIVYSTDPAVMAGQVAPVVHQESMREWEERPRKTKRQNRDAQNALNCEYRRRAAACGMSFEGYLARFNITLK
ncbi:hypothetical protein [Escherichia phage vB_EcoP_LHP]